MTRTGYGKTQIYGKTVSPHRVIAHLLFRPLRECDVIAHRCDNPKCCNPEHLFITTHAGNIADRDAKGRQAKGRGVHFNKLSEADVQAIRQQFKDGRRQQAIADSFGVCSTTIWNIVNRKTFKWLP